MYTFEDCIRMLEVVGQKLDLVGALSPVNQMLFNAQSIDRASFIRADL